MKPIFQNSGIQNSVISMATITELGMLFQNTEHYTQNLSRTLPFSTRQYRPSSVSLIPAGICDGRGKNETLPENKIGSEGKANKYVSMVIREAGLCEQQASEQSLHSKAWLIVCVCMRKRERESVCE